MVVALSAIANGGTLMEPHIAKALMRNGKIIKEIKPKKIRRVISEKTSRQMMEILKFVVENGTGKKAAIDRFEVAGNRNRSEIYYRNPVLFKNRIYFFIYRLCAST